MERFHVALISTGGTIEKTYLESEGMLANGESVLSHMLKSLQLCGVEIERINPDGTTTTEAAASDNQQIVELEIPMDSPTKLFRARVRLGDQDFGSTLRPIVEQGAVPNLDEIRPSSINLRGNSLTLQFPPEHTAVRNQKFFPEGFPLFLNEGPVRLQPGRVPGSYIAALNDGVIRKFRFEFEAALDRLRGLGDGTVPVYADRQLTGRVAVPEFNALGDSVDLFPFSITGKSSLSPLRVVPSLGLQQPLIRRNPS